MAKKKRKKGKKKPRRPARLGPFGKFAEIDWRVEHARKRAVQRFLNKGVTEEELEHHFRFPQGKKKDEVDDSYGDRRFLRQSTIEVQGELHRIRFVFLAEGLRAILITVVDLDD